MEENRKTEMKTAVIGAGMMGQGIAQAAAQGGLQVAIHDLTEERVSKGLSEIERMLQGGVKRQKMTPGEAQRVRERIVSTTDLARAVRGAQVVIEAVFEELEVKREVFEKLSSLTPPGTTLATNTSSLDVDEIVDAMPRGRRKDALGLHFFYPAAINKLVEVIPGESTAREVLDAALWCVKHMGKTPIVVSNRPGFAINRFFVPLLNEATRIYEEGITNVATIEQAGKEAFGISMGFFELMNVTGIPNGIPVCYHSTASLGRKLGRFYDPSETLERQFKSGAGWNIADGPVQSEKLTPIKRRLLGVAFGICGQMIDEKVASPKDIDLGAQVGLRWKEGPFAMMNKIGISEALSLVLMLEKIHPEFRIPIALQEHARAGKPWGV